MSKNRSALIWIGLPVAGLAVGLVLMRGDEPVRESPLVPSRAAGDAIKPRVVNAHALLEWGRQETPLAVVESMRDELPNGLALAMIPLLVDWEGSELEGESPFVLVRNVRVAGNPVSGRLVFATVRIPLDGIRRVEWCLTLSATSRFLGHGQLRFVFEPDRRPTVFDGSGRPFAMAPHLDDFILSFETWREPRTRFEASKGLDPDAYALTARAFGGAQRFLEDSMRGTPWICYPIDLPDVATAKPTVLLTGLLFGDSLARRMIHAMVEEGQLEVPGVEELVDFTEDDLAQVRAVFSEEKLPADPMTSLMGQADLSYHLLKASCIVHALTVVQIALNRIYSDHDLGDPPRLDIVPKFPGWIDELSTASRADMVKILPGALLFVARHGNVMPLNSWRILDDVGVLERGKDGKPVEYGYDPKAMTPYGLLGDNML